ncbi:MAG: helix-turn-helix transcriptional regulator [bacterium]|nr:helix-turn-helix transcriptional regulator [bacterium]
MASSKKPKNRKTTTLPPAETFTLTTLEQVRIVADPLRVRILEALCTERTTKQVAESIGEKPTKLYHHVEALERVGLIRLTRTRPNRGTLEKYYQAVARAFRADPSLFGGEPTREEASEVGAAVRGIFLRTADEFERLFARENVADLQETAIVSQVQLHATPDEIEEVRRQIQQVLDDLQKDQRDRITDEDECYRLTMAFFPLDPEPAEGD